MPPLIHIACKHREENKQPVVDIKVSDNGIGFEPEYEDKVFETFLHLNSKDQDEGSGLGLSSCKKIATRHGGSISARAAKDQGDAFLVSLPVHQKTKWL